MLSEENFEVRDVAAVQIVEYKLGLSTIFLAADPTVLYTSSYKFRTLFHDNDRLFGVSETITVTPKHDDLISAEPIAHNATVFIERYEAPDQVARVARERLSSAEDVAVMYDEMDRLTKVSAIVYSRENYETLAFAVQRVFSTGNSLEPAFIDYLERLSNASEFIQMDKYDQALALHYLADSVRYGVLDERAANLSTHREIALGLVLDEIGIVDRYPEEFSETALGGNAYTLLAELVCSDPVFVEECFTARRRLFASPIALNSGQINAFYGAYLPQLFRYSASSPSSLPSTSVILDDLELKTEWCSVADRQGQLAWREATKRVLLQNYSLVTEIGAHCET